MARIIRESGVKEVPLRQGLKDNRLEYRLETDPRFLRRIEEARDSLRAGHGVCLEDAETK